MGTRMRYAKPLIVLVIALALVMLCAGPGLNH
jgi:hypothetical protein